MAKFDGNAWIKGLLEKHPETDLFVRVEKWRERISKDAAKWLESLRDEDEGKSGKTYFRADTQVGWVFLPVDQVEDGDILVCYAPSKGHDYDTLAVIKEKKA